jgi:hypothetical protein
MCECFHSLKYKTPEQWHGMLLNLMREEKEPDAHRKIQLGRSRQSFLSKISSRANEKYPKVMLFNKRRGTQHGVWVKNSLLWQWRAFTFVGGAIIVSTRLLTGDRTNFFRRIAHPTARPNSLILFILSSKRQASVAGRSQSDEKRIRAENAIK